MTLMAGVADILGAPTDPTVEAEKPVESTFGWATVTSALPFRIRKDGETDELPMTPEVIGAGGFTAGARVWCQFFGLRVIVFGAGGVAAGGGGGVLAAVTASGGGRRTAVSTGVGWSGRFVTMGSGQNPSVPAGFFDIAQPPNGTIIPVYGSSGATSVTVSGGYVPLTNWDTLYYELPIGQVSTSLPGNFRIVGYSGAFTVPTNWFPVVTKNGDIDSAPFRWFDGREQDYWRNFPGAPGWSDFGSGYQGSSYKRESGWVELQGTLKGGAGTIGTMPSGYQPALSHIYVVSANNGFARVTVQSTGIVGLATLSAGATTATLNLDGIRYEANQ